MLIECLGLFSHSYRILDLILTIMVSSIITPILQIRKLQQRQAKELFQSPTCSELQSQNAKPECLIPEPVAFALLLP